MKTIYAKNDDFEFDLPKIKSSNKKKKKSKKADKKKKHSKDSNAMVYKAGNNKNFKVKSDIKIDLNENVLMSAINGAVSIVDKLTTKK